MIDKKIMMDRVRNQLAIDYNCSPDDFLKDGFIFTKAKENVGRRPFPFITPRLEMITMGNSVVINASEEILPYIQKNLEGKERFEAFCLPFAYGINPYFLPAIDNIHALTGPDGFEYELVEKQGISKLHDISGFGYAIKYDVNDPFPELLVAVAKYKGEIVGMAGTSADCKTMCQMGVDVLFPYRGKGIAAKLVNMLTLETLNRGYIPYYFTDCSNVFSQRVAIRAGYFPAWSHCYKARLEDILK